MSRDDASDSITVPLNQFSRREWLALSSGAVSAGLTGYIGTTESERSESAQSDTPTNVVVLNTDHYPYRQMLFARDQAPAAAPDTPAYDRLAEEGVRFTSAYCATPICVPSRATMMTGTYPHNHGLLTNGFATRREKIPTDTDYYSDTYNEKGTPAFYWGKWHVGNTPTTAQEYGFEGWSLPRYGWPYDTDRYAEYLATRDLPEPTIELNWHLYNDVDELNPVRPTERRNQFHDPNVGASAGVFETPKETHEAFFTTHMATQRMEERATNNEPFFARIDVWGPHQPYWTADEFFDTVEPTEIPEYPNFDLDRSERPGHHERFLNRPNQNLTDATWEDVRTVLAMQFEHVTTVDNALNTVLEMLDELGIADDTLVIYTADHGDVLGTNGGGFDKGWLLVEETVRIPLLMRWPNGGIEGGKTCDELVCNIDFAPTLYDAAGAEPPASMDGRSLVNLAKQPNSAVASGRWRDSLLIEHHGHYGQYYFQRALYHDRYKYVAHWGYNDELYDLGTDPYETNNRIDDAELAGVRRRMQTTLARKMKHHSDDSLFATNFRTRLVQNKGRLDPIAQWRFNNSNEDSSSYDHPVTLENGTGYDDNAVEGSHSVQLDGSDDYINVADGGEPFLSRSFARRTVSMWIKAESTAGNQILYNEGAAQNGLGIRITDGTLEAGVANDGTLATVRSSFDRTDWTHVAVVFDTGALRLSVNGTEVASNPDVGYQSAGGGYWGGEIGTAESSFWEPGYFGGHVDETTIYNSALSAEEITRLYQAHTQ